MNIDELHDAFERELTANYGVIDVCGHTYDAGRVLRKIDPVAFRTAANDWADSMGFDDADADAE